MRSILDRITVALYDWITDLYVKRILTPMCEESGVDSYRVEVRMVPDYKKMMEQVCAEIERQGQSIH